MLRHKGVFGDMEAVDRSDKEPAILKRYRGPVVAEFRRGGDMGAVVRTIKTNKFVEVRAAVGAGKSTKIPMMLAKATGSLVIHTIPFAIAAQYLADFLVTDEVDGGKFVYMDDLTSDMPAHGVVLMSNAFFFARYAYDAFKGVDNAILYLDESHESDCWTATLRTLAPAITSFRSVIKATATATPDSRMTPDLPSKRVIRKYDKVDVATWSGGDRGKPWAVSQIDRHVMICIDRKTTRDRLAVDYRAAGFVVRDCCDTDYDFFRETIRLLKDPNEGIVIVLVDYKFRSSFSIPGVEVFIDSCEVAVPGTSQGAPCTLYRTAYDFEIQQFAGRGARLPGSPATIFVNSDVPSTFMCDIESLECDAANILYRIMGFKPPLDFEKYDFYDGDVPIDIAAAMASAHPLRLCPDMSRVPWVNGHKALMEEKRLAAYQYELSQRRVAKVVSCHTVVDVDRPRTPPPAVPRRHRSMSVDRDALEAYSSSRDSSPSAVFTLDTEIYDNVSAIRDIAAEKPKRVAKRVLEARAAEERARAEARLSGDVSPVGPTVTSVPNLPVQVEQQLAGQQGALARQQTVVAKAAAADSEEAFRMPADSLRRMHTVLRDKHDNGPGTVVGRYYHYHGMDAAPDKSSTFFRGVDSVVAYCEGHNAKRYVKGLDDSEKLYAMRALVEAANHSTAVAMGMQRLFREVSGRPPEEWQSIVDHGAMLEEVDWMVRRCAEEQAKVRVFHSILPLFAKYELDQIPPPLELEQQVMLEVMKRFERVAVKKDPDKSSAYWQRLNGRSIMIGPRDSSRRNYGAIEYN